MGGLVFTVPVHATVMMFAFPGSPQVTMTGGTGAVIAVPFHTALLLIFESFFLGAPPQTLPLS